MDKILDIAAEKAEYDSRWAIAYGLLKIADRLDGIGFNKEDSLQPGCLEFIGMQLEDLNKSLMMWDFSKD